MGKVQANHIDAGANQVTENRLGVGGRPESGNDLCAALGGRIGEAKFSERHGDNSK
jgi:hypothetical protein